jgi:hypothetical protein
VPRRRTSDKSAGSRPLSFVIGLCLSSQTSIHALLCDTARHIHYRTARTPTFPYSHTTQRLAMAIDEATQTNGVAQPDAGHPKKDEAEKSTWSVESGMS